VHRRILAGLALPAAALALSSCGGGGGATTAKSHHGAPGNPIQTFRSRPDLTPPVLRVDRRARDVARGYVFLAPKMGPGQYGPMIVDNHGRVRWFHPLPKGQEAFDFRVQRYEGKPRLTWWQGTVTSTGHGSGEDIVADRHYHVIARFRGSHAERPDLHEFRITPRGTALITSYHTVPYDLRPVGGPRDGQVLDSIVQEVNLKTGKVLLDWHSIDHIGLRESEVKPKKGKPYDYFHINSIFPEGSKLLLSARNTWGVYEIDRRTGKVLSRLGGKRSDFKMGPGTRFAYQHDAERQPNGDITLFDDGGGPRVQPQSRVLRLREHPKTHTVTLVRQYTHPRPVAADSQGNGQVLPNGDMFVGWGDQPHISEFTQAGGMNFDLALPGQDQSYRAYRFPWVGEPIRPPAVAAFGETGGPTIVYASWNGSTQVRRWRVLGGPDPHALQPLRTVRARGFETKIRLRNNIASVAVRALGAHGRRLGSSRTISPSTGG
jgi:hypothetical protein